MRSRALGRRRSLKQQLPSWGDLSPSGNQVRKVILPGTLKRDSTAKSRQVSAFPSLLGSWASNRLGS
jgi:hypothetical protein